MFNFQRFLLLLRRRFALDRRELLVNLAVMTGIAVTIIGGSLAMLYFKANTTQENITGFFGELQRSLFGTFVCISGSVFASKMFAEYGDKNNCIASLMLPATKFEKWLAPFILSTIYFLATVMVVFYVAQVFNIAAFNAIRPYQISIGAANGIFGAGIFLETLGALCVVHSIYFLGSLQFRDNQWWSTTLVVMAGATVYGLIMLVFSELIWPKGVDVNNQMGQYFAQIKGDGIYKIPVGQGWEAALGLLVWIAPPIFWGLSYLKLTEKEV